MKKNLIAVPAIALIILGSFYFISCNNNSQAASAETADSAKSSAPVVEQKPETIQTPDSALETKPLITAPETPAPEKTPAKEDKKNIAKSVPEEKPVASPVPDKADVDAGKNLLATSDCLACHSLQDKKVGPAYMEVAKKYSYSEANVQLLAGKVINGGTGVWGQIPMTPHAALSQDDAKKMVKYILSLNSK